MYAGGNGDSMGYYGDVVIESIFPSSQRSSLSFPLSVKYQHVQAPRSALPPFYHPRPSHSKSPSNPFSEILFVELLERKFSGILGKDHVGRTLLAVLEEIRWLGAA